MDKRRQRKLLEQQAKLRDAMMAHNQGGGEKQRSSSSSALTNKRAGQEAPTTEAKIPKKARRSVFDGVIGGTRKNANIGVPPRSSSTSTSSSSYSNHTRLEGGSSSAFSSSSKYATKPAPKSSTNEFMNNIFGKGKERKKPPPPPTPPPNPQNYEDHNFGTPPSTFSQDSVNSSDLATAVPPTPDATTTATKPLRIRATVRSSSLQSSYSSTNLPPPLASLLPYVKKSYHSAFSGNTLDLDYFCSLLLNRTYLKPRSPEAPGTEDLSNKYKPALTIPTGPHGVSTTQLVSDGINLLGGTSRPLYFLNSHHYILHFLPLLLSETVSEMISKGNECYQCYINSRGRGGKGGGNDKHAWMWQGHEGDRYRGDENKRMVVAERGAERGDVMKTASVKGKVAGGNKGRLDLIELALYVRDARKDKRNGKMDGWGMWKDRDEEYRRDDVLVVYRRGGNVKDVLEGRCRGIMVRVESTRKSLDRMYVTAGKKAWEGILNDLGCLEKKDRYKEIEVEVLKAGNLVTANREFMALVNLEKMKIKEDVFNAPKKDEGFGRDQDDEPLTPITPKGGMMSPSMYGNPKFLPRTGSERKVWKRMGGRDAAKFGEDFLRYIKDNYNGSQVEGISSVTQNPKGITLIKGPPGTGKTTTLVGAINALHLRAINEYHSSIADMVIQISKGKLGREEIEKRFREAVSKKPRLLVTAPSNGAVDGIIARIFKDGFKDGLGKRYNPHISRVGRGRGENVKLISLDVQVEKIFKDAGDHSIVEPKILSIRGQAQKLQEEINDLTRRLAALGSVGLMQKNWEVRCKDDFKYSGAIYFLNHESKTTSLQPPPAPARGEKGIMPSDCHEYKHYLRVLISKVEHHIQRCKDIENYTISKLRQDMDTKHVVEANLMDVVNIVFVTLGSCGSPSLQNTRRFDVVVVDEAAQSTEPSTLIALGLGAERAVLVGDPMQLPATIFDQEGGRKGGYNRSLFERLEDGGAEVEMLNIQYRMRSAISKFPREEFYGGLLLDGDGVDDRAYGNKLLAVVKDKCPCLGEMRVLDFKGKEEKSGMSLVNNGEIDVVVVILEALGRVFGVGNLSDKVGIITPYASQVGAIKRRLGTEENELRGLVNCECNTVDGYQGREKEIIILSLVRAGKGEGVGFLEDRRRMNVALTRPREMLIVVSDVERVGKDPIWGKLFKQAEDERKIVRLGSTVPKDLRKLPDPTVKAFDALETNKASTSLSFDELPTT